MTDKRFLPDCPAPISKEALKRMHEKIQKRLANRKKTK
jgi:hypothetical protein|tara:strand:- start:1937 stop:2050 length:114 start_codon:yes stop_codon:yes gene_type:complete